jgi:transcriptional regulator with XRE-family HTH domain
MTQEELADRIGRHVTTIRNVEGDRSSSRSTVDAVAAVLGTTAEALGFHFRRAIRPNELTAAQREIVEELLALSAEDQEAVRAMLQALRRKAPRS